MFRLRIRTSIITAMVMAVCLCGCPEPDPLVADFTAEVTAGNAPFEVQFTDTSVASGAPADSWLWAFGDGGTSAEQNPAHTYLHEGSYNVTLQIGAGAVSRTVVKNGFITVAPPTAYTVDFTASTLSGDAPLTTTFTPTIFPSAPDDASYTWSFGDGGTSNSVSPTHTYLNAGKFAVSLVVQTPLGPIVKTRNNYIDVDAVEPEGGCDDGGAVPVITQCPGAQTLTLSGNCSASMPDLRAQLRATDACGIANVTQSPAAGTSVTANTTVQFIVRDVDGRTSTCTAEISVSDTTPPAFTTCPPAQALLRPVGCAVQVPSLASIAVATDNCGIPTVTQTPSAGTLLEEDTTVTLTARDGAGLTATCTVAVTVRDAALPVISQCPASRVLQPGAGCSASIPNLLPEVVASDNCGIASIVQSPPVGTRITSATDVTITVTDTSGNVATCSLSIGVQDTVLPSITTCASNASAIADAGCRAIVPDLTGNVVATDACGIAAITQSPAPGTTMTSSTLVTISVRDNSGNVSTCSASVSLLDNTPPTFTAAPNGRNVSADQDCNALMPDLSTSASATDTCSAVTFSQSPAAGTSIEGTVTATLTARDSAGNTTNTTVSVTVIDDTAPVITSCPPGRELYLREGCQTTVPRLTHEVGRDDNCGIASVTQFPAEGTVITAATTVTITVTDTSGLTATCDVELLPLDKWPPTIQCPGNRVQPLSAACSATLPDFTGMALVEDQCGEVTVTQNPAAGTIFTTTTNVSVRATDEVGLFYECLVRVTPVDTTPPTITNCPIVPKLTRDTFCEATVPELTASIEATDNCGVASVTQTPVAGAVIGLATNATITVTDTSGNVETCSVLLDLVDCSTPPQGAEQGTVNLDRTVEGPGNYAPGQPLDVTVTLRSFGNEPANNLVLSEKLPTGWEYAQITKGNANNPEVICDLTGCTLNFNFPGTVQLPLTFTYSVLPPPDSAGIQNLRGSATYTSPLWGPLTTNAEETVIPLDETVLILDFDLPSTRVYTPGQPLDVQVEVRKVGVANVLALGLTVNLPAAWKFNSIVDGDIPAVVPATGTTGVLEFAWIAVPQFTAEMTLRVTPPLGATGVASFDGQALYYTEESGSALYTNTEILQVPKGAPAGEGEGEGENAFIVSDISPDFVTNFGASLTIQGDFSAPYDGGSLGVYMASAPPTLNPAGDQRLNLESSSSSSIEASLPGGLLLTPGSYLVYVAAQKDGNWLLSNPEDIFATFCGVGGEKDAKNSNILTGQVIANNGGLFHPGDVVEVALTVDWAGVPGNLSAVGLYVRMPNGWIFDSMGTSECMPAIYPLQPTSIPEFAWIVVPDLPVSFTILIRAMQSAEPGEVTCNLEYRIDGPALYDSLFPATLTLAP